MSTLTSNSLGKDAWLRLRANRMAMLSLFVLAGIFIVSLFGPALCSFSYEEQNLDKVFQSPDREHLFGTDNLGRDLFARTTYGGRISLAVGLLATLVSLVIGVSYGMISGYAGGRVDSLMMRGVDVLYSLPFIIFVILLMVLFGRNFLLLFVAIGAVEWLTMARITRAQTLNLKNTEFIEAARALGFSNLRIIFRHILPNLLGPIIVYATLTVPAVMLLEAVLSFLGLGVQPPTPSWGNMLTEGRASIDFAWWISIFPGLAILVTVLSFNLVGEGLRQKFDPRDSHFG